MKTKEELIELGAKNGLEINFHDEPEAGREYHYWYGGTVVTFVDIATKEEYELVANGDIWAKYYDEDGDEKEYVKDKRNNAQFYNTMMGVVKDDNRLDELTERWEEQKFPALQIENGNWFELFSNYQDEKPNFEEVLEESKFTLAIEEAIELIVDFKKL